MAHQNNNNESHFCWYLLLDALINPRDNWHTIALDYAQKYADDYLYLPSPKLSTPLTSNEKRHLK